MTRSRPLIAVATAALAALALTALAFAARADANIYRTNYNAATIGRANLDGTGVDQGFIHPAYSPWGLAADDEHIYWAASGTIGRANLDGTGVDGSFVAFPPLTPERSPSDRRTHLLGELIGDRPRQPRRHRRRRELHFRRHRSEGSPSTAPTSTGATETRSAAPTSMGRRRRDFVIPVRFSGWGCGRRHLRLLAPEGAVGGVGRQTSMAPAEQDRRAGRIAGGCGRPSHIFWTRRLFTIGLANLDGTGPNKSFISGANYPWGLAVTPQPLATSAPTSLTFGTPTPTPQGTLSPPQNTSPTPTPAPARCGINGFAFAGTNPDDYLISSDTCRGDIAPTDSCTAQVRFAPGAEGSRAASMTALTNAPSDPITTFAGSAGPAAAGPARPRRTAGSTGTRRPHRDHKAPGPHRAPPRSAATAGARTRAPTGSTARSVSSSPRARCLVGWSLANKKGRVLAQGTKRSLRGKFRLPLSPKILKLRKGSYLLRIEGNSEPVKVRVRSGRGPLAPFPPTFPRPPEQSLSGLTKPFFGCV